MKIFVSYSFRPETRWVEDLVIPLIKCFGHEPITGRLLDGRGLDDEVRNKIRQCRRVLCFVTRGASQYDQNGQLTGYLPPDWVRDELMISRGADRLAIEFRERGVTYAGAAPFHAYCELDRDQLPKLLLDVAERIAEWPIGPLQLRLKVPPAQAADLEQAANAGTLYARCRAVDESGAERMAEDLVVRVRDERLTIPFWVQSDPRLSIEIEIALGPRRLVCKGISPSVRDAHLSLV